MRSSRTYFRLQEMQTSSGRSRDDGGSYQDHQLPDCSPGRACNYHPRKIFEYYQVVWPDYRRDTDDDPKAPKLGAADILRIDDLVELYSVHCAGKITEGYFGLCFDCTWDDEHDLGIRFRNYQIEVVGGSDVGFHLLPDKK